MITIRDFRHGDAGTICDFKRQSVSASFSGARFDMDIFRRCLLEDGDAAPGMIKVAESGSAIVGYIWLKAVGSATGKAGRVAHIFVREDFRRQGLGRKLLDAAEDIFRKMGLSRSRLTVTASNKAALALYESAGYRVTRYVMDKAL